MFNTATNEDTSEVPSHQASQEKAEPDVKAQSENEPDTQTVNSGQGVSNVTGSSTQETQSKNKQNKQVDNSANNSSTVFNPIDNPQSLPSVVVGVEDKPDVKEPSLPIIGFNLSSFVLCIISGFILLLVIFLFAKEFDASSSIKIPTEANISDSTYARKIELVRMIQEEKKSYRDFTVQISQMILLNLLLPVLTAILGYIFASNKNKE